MDFNLFIRNGRVLDGVNDAYQTLNIGVKGETITYIGREIHPTVKVVDAEGLIVSPGARAQYKI